MIYNIKTSQRNRKGSHHGIKPADAGTKHFTSESEARSYAEKIVKTTTKDTKEGMKKMTKSSPKVWPPTEHGCHWATYSGWEGDDTIISAGGYVDGVYIPGWELYSARLWDRLSESVRDELEPLAAGDPAEWNDKILELKKSGKVSYEDEEILDALWVSGKVCHDGEVTIYGTDATVAEMDDAELHEMGLERLESDDDDDDDEDDDEDEDE